VLGTVKNQRLLLVQTFCNKFDIVRHPLSVLFGRAFDHIEYGNRLFPHYLPWLGRENLLKASLIKKVYDLLVIFAGLWYIMSKKIYDIFVFVFYL
jgi:hypothetical protein